MPLILTLKIDARSFEFFDALRRKHFPPERNFLAAHVTLFHHLPEEKVNEIKQTLEELCRETTSFSLHFKSWRFLGKGSAMLIESSELSDLRKRLAEFWLTDLTAQDRQKFQPHITVQNKVAPDEARGVFENLTNNWKANQGEAKGLTLWHYAGGPWKFETEFLFGK